MKTLVNMLKRSKKLSRFLFVSISILGMSILLFTSSSVMAEESAEMKNLNKKIKELQEPVKEKTKEELDKEIDDADKKIKKELNIPDIKEENLPEFPKSAFNKHGFKFGLNFSNSMYIDKSMPDGQYTGFFRPYFQYMYNEKYTFFTRVKLSYKHYMTAPENTDKATFDTTLEVLKAKIKFDRKKILRLGRDFYKIGSGVLFAGNADGAAFKFKSSIVNFNINTMYSGDYGQSNCSINISGCKTSKSAFDITPDLPVDAKVEDAGKRFFMGGDVSRRMFNQTLSIMGLFSKDMIEEDSANTTLYEFNPLYVGALLKGYVYSSKFRYRVEGIYQGGKTYNKMADDKSTSAEFSAYAGIVKLTWSLPWLRKKIVPSVNFMGAIASGDADKSSLSTPSQTNTDGKDTSFYYFGGFSAGMALKPRLSNIQVLRFGVQCKPLYFIYSLRNIALKINFTNYQKNKSDGVISDYLASEDNKDIGNAVDVGIVFKIKSDIKFVYGFGYFKPGAAYPETITNSDGTQKNGRETRVAHMISFTMMF